MAHTTTCDVAISDPSRFMKQLVRHFAHKVPAEFDDVSAHVEFETARAQLRAHEGRLEMTVTAEDAATAERYAGVLDRHLVKFAFREELTFDWHETATSAS